MASQQARQTRRETDPHDDAAARGHRSGVQPQDRLHLLGIVGRGDHVAAGVEGGGHDLELLAGLSRDQDDVGRATAVGPIHPIGLPQDRHRRPERGAQLVASLLAASRDRDVRGAGPSVRSRRDQLSRGAGPDDAGAHDGHPGPDRLGRVGSTQRRSSPVSSRQPPPCRGGSVEPRKRSTRPTSPPMATAAAARRRPRTVPPRRVACRTRVPRGPDGTAGMVGLAGIEPATSPLSGVRSNRLSYSPGTARTGWLTTRAGRSQYPRRSTARTSTRR